MIIRVDVGAGTVELREPAAFNGFHVEAAPGTDEAAVAGVLGDAGRVAGAGHVWVRATAVEGWAGAAADDAWRDGYAKMLAYAAGKGWLDESGEFVQAHIESWS